MFSNLFKDKTPEFNIDNTLFVARPGIVFILAALVVWLLCLVLGFWIARQIFFLVFLFAIWFFRDPDRVTPPGEFGLSPADGRVIRIDPGATNPATGEKALKISVFMNVFSVHVNRVPLSGTLVDQRYHPGTLVNASFDKASEHNERNVLVVRDERGREFAMVQIAGLIARRIVSWVVPGDELKRGQRFGMIRFGSRVDLYLPPDAVPMVALGQGVRAGWTPVWEYPK
ncbi:MAG: phosphatidylserine decarboxylase family protein [Deltaproteobacteria bacterium]|nr:phosphatidylserine decarboxylase family protein [Deltaproteobacteria bacterium]